MLPPIGPYTEGSLVPNCRVMLWLVNIPSLVQRTVLVNIILETLWFSLFVKTRGFYKTGLQRNAFMFH